MLVNIVRFLDMLKISYPTVCFTLIIILLSFLSGCATVQPIVVKSNTTSSKPLTRGEKVLLLPPYIHYERVENEAILYPEEYGASQISSLLILNTKNKLIEKGLKVFTINDLPENKKHATNVILSKLKEKYDAIIKLPKRKAEILPLLEDLHKISDFDIVCIELLKAKVGTINLWNPFSGQILPSTDSVDIKAMLINSKTYEYQWINEIFLRKLPSENQTSNITDALFKNLTTI